VSVALADVLALIRARVSYLEAAAQPTGEDGWHDCDALTAADLDRVVDGAGSAWGEPAERRVTASMLAQSYAHRVAAISLAAYAVGLPWPSPAAASTSVRLAEGRATAVSFRDPTLGGPDDVAGLAEAVFPSHLVRFVSIMRDSERLGERLLWANVAASCMSAFRSMEGSARDRGDAEERGAVRRRADRLLRAAPWLAGTGFFDPAGEDWGWQRTACCLWYRTSGGRRCEGCSLSRP